MTSNQSDYSLSDSSGFIEDNSLDLDRESYASESDGANTTCNSASSGSSDSAFTSNEDIEHQKVGVRDKVYVLCAKEQLLMFLTGSAGAGKTTAVKLAQILCFEFCRAVNILWNKIFQVGYNFVKVVFWKYPLSRIYLKCARIFL